MRNKERNRERVGPEAREGKAYNYTEKEDWEAARSSGVGQGMRPDPVNPSAVRGHALYDCAWAKMRKWRNTSDPSCKCSACPNYESYGA